MPDPITLTLLAKTAMGIAGKIGVKAYFVGKMAGLKSLIASTLGPTAANVSVGALAAAATAVYWEKHVKKNSDAEAVDAAVRAGVSRDIGWQILKWLALR
jgi:hypothetical protein